MKKILLLSIVFVAIETYSQTSFFSESFSKRPSIIDSIIKLMPGYKVSKIDSSLNENPVSYIAYLNKEKSEPILIFYIKDKNVEGNIMRDLKIAAPLETAFGLWKKWIDAKATIEKIMELGVDRRFINGKFFIISRHERTWMLYL